MTTKNKELALFPIAGEPMFSVVPVGLIQPAPGEVDIPSTRSGSTTQLLADLTVEPVQHWAFLPVGEDGIPQLVALSCQICRDRYYTPGTIYYGNATLYTQCMATCT